MWNYKRCRSDRSRSYLLFRESFGDVQADCDGYLHQVYNTKYLIHVPLLLKDSGIFQGATQLSNEPCAQGLCHDGT